MKTATVPNKHPLLLLLAACLAIAWQTEVVRAQDSSGLNQLQGIPERAYSKVIRSADAVVEPKFSPENLRAKTFIYPQVLLGAHHSLVFVEQTRSDNGTRLRPDSAQPGVRIVEIRFGAKGAESRELWKNVGELATARGLKLRPFPPRLELNYFDNELTSSGQSLLVRYNSEDARFLLEEGADDSGNTPDQISSKAWTVTQPVAGELLIQSTQRADLGCCRREYRIHLTEDKQFEILGSIDAGFGTAWSNHIELSVPLPVSDEAKMLSAALQNLPVQPPASAGISATDGMLFIPFPLPPDSSGRDPRELNAVAGIAIDMEYLELRFLSTLINNLMDQVREIEKRTTGGIGDDKVLKLFRDADAGLTLAKSFAALQQQTVNDRKVLDGITDTQAKLSSLVFQFPFDYEAKKYAVSYAPGSDAMFLSVDGARWTNGNETAQPLQFKAPNATLVFAMQFSEAESVSLSEAQERELCSIMAASFGVSSLEKAIVMTRLPPGRLDVEVREDGSDASKISSLKMRTARIDSNGRMILIFSATEADSFSLLTLHLQNTGLPVAYDVRKFLTPEGVAVQPATRKYDPVRVESKIRDEKKFEVVVEAKSTIEVKVTVPAAVFSQLNQNVVTVKLRYPDDLAVKYSVEVSSEKGKGGVASVEMATRFSRSADGSAELAPGVSYSLDGQNWKLSEYGLYGSVYVEN